MVSIKDRNLRETISISPGIHLLVRCVKFNVFKIVIVAMDCTIIYSQVP